MIRDISPQMSGLISNWCNALLYGITLIAYFTCVRILTKGRHSRKRSATWILLGTSTIQSALATVYVALGLRLLVEGFIWAVDEPGSTLAYWINPSTRSQVISKAVYLANSIIGDSILLWRVYVVWGGNWYICVVPAVLVISTTVTGYIAIANLIRIKILAPDSLFAILRWIIVTWSTSIATQIICTLLIAGKIWWHVRSTQSKRARIQYTTIIAIVVESGAVYTLATVFLLAFADLKTQAGQVIGDSLGQISAIVPTLIIIRIELTRNSASTYQITGSAANKITPKPQNAILALSNLECKEGTLHPEESVVKISAGDVEMAWKGQRTGSDDETLAYSAHGKNASQY